MARKQTNTVDYFPHVARPGKTLFILENKFGNDAYAFWFKLLELLAVSENHFYDCNDHANWEYLIAKTRSEDISATEMLTVLAKLGNIDGELWKNRVIWCQAFVDNIAEVYKKRKRPIPQKPGKTNNYHRNANTTDIAVTEKAVVIDNLEQPITEKRQSKVDKSKVNTTTPNESNLVFESGNQEPVIVVDKSGNKNLDKLVALLKPALQKQELVKEMLKSYLADKGYKHVESNIIYAKRLQKKQVADFLQNR